MAIIPRLAQPRPSVIGRPVSGRSLIEPWPGAAHVRHRAIRVRQCVLEVRQRVGGGVGRRDAGVGEPGVGGQAAVEKDGRLEEVEDVNVRLVGGAVAGQVEGGEAGRVLGELVRPEVPVGLVLRDPVAVRISLCLKGKGRASSARVHVFEQVVAAEWYNEAADVGAVVWRDEGACTHEKSIMALEIADCSVFSPLGSPLVVFGLGSGSYWRLRSQY